MVLRGPIVIRSESNTALIAPLSRFPMARVNVGSEPTMFSKTWTSWAVEMRTAPPPLGPWPLLPIALRGPICTLLHPPT